MAHLAGRVTMKIMTVVVAIPVGIASKAVVVRVWSLARPADAPRKPGEKGVKWGDAVGWASLSAAGLVVTNLAARKGAEEMWRTVIGGEPPPRALSKAEKKQVKKQRNTSHAPAESSPA
ncbi:MAG: hypothetical protein DLM57_01615 [Pseudonocardiales bacterium]|nr:MAG: hypothetical protein DLM57_01615 [Pseudonocardiales bacterium]